MKARTSVSYVVVLLVVFAGVTEADAQLVTYRGWAEIWGSMCFCPPKVFLLDGTNEYRAVSGLPQEFYEKHVQVTGTLSWCYQNECGGGEYVLNVQKADSFQNYWIHRYVGWNLVSQPLELDSADYAMLFLSRVSRPVSYHRGYVVEDTVVNGQGYWLKSEVSGTFSVFGYPAVFETVKVHSGWNIVGSISVPLPVGEILTPDSTLTLSPFYWYSPDAGQYVTSNPLEPWRAYWVKANHDGTIILRDPRYRSSMPQERTVRVVETEETPPDYPSEPVK
jgi:hypothetical protein